MMAGFKWLKKESIDNLSTHQKKVRSFAESNDFITNIEISLPQLA